MGSKGVFFSLVFLLDELDGGLFDEDVVHPAVDVALLVALGAVSAPNHLLDSARLEATLLREDHHESCSLEAKVIATREALLQNEHSSIDLLSDVVRLERAFERFDEVALDSWIFTDFVMDGRDDFCVILADKHENWSLHDEQFNLLAHQSQNLALGLAATDANLLHFIVARSQLLDGVVRDKHRGVVTKDGLEAFHPILG